MQDHPFCSIPELMQATGHKYVGKVYPEVRFLTDGVIQTRDTVRNTYHALQSEVTSAKVGIAEALYQSAISPSSYFHQAKVEMGYLNNPFALTITAVSPDFEHLDSRDIAGYYKKSLAITLNTNTYRAPLIAIKGDAGLAKDAILKHERNHARNELVRESLSKANKRKLWGKPIAKDSGRIDSVRSLRKSWNGLQSQQDKAAIITLDYEWKNIIDQCLAKSKDEVLVRLSLNEGMSPMYKRQGLYDPLKDNFYVYDNSDLSNLLWNSYVTTMSNQIRQINEALNTYRFYDLKERAEIVPWMLMRAPMEKWGATLNETGLTAEIDLLNKIGKQPQEDATLKRILSTEDSLHVHDLASYLLGQSRK